MCIPTDALLRRSRGKSPASFLASRVALRELGDELRLREAIFLQIRSLAARANGRERFDGATVEHLALIFRQSENCLLCLPMTPEHTARNDENEKGRCNRGVGADGFDT
jgi:hypothetical protein